MRKRKTTRLDTILNRMSLRREGEGEGERAIYRRAHSSVKLPIMQGTYAQICRPTLKVQCLQPESSWSLDIVGAILGEGCDP